MYTPNEIWEQSVADEITAHIKYPEHEASILYGGRLERVGDKHNFYIAYEGDYYRVMPRHFVDTILELGWRKGLCQLLIDRCTRTMEARQESLDKHMNAEFPDKREIDRLSAVISNLQSKIDKYAVQL